ncbi:hypothetical protein PybrP1_006192 [[Pythium] brassicae (nom. inval.)]|nr:hypothetical protein PybrP1_006192 [[Pythium] brassicae (nom. inval.)]
MWAAARGRLCRRASSSLRAAPAPPPFALRSTLWVPTEKEVPADAAIPSHQLLVRGGFVRKSGHGTFAFLPLGRRVVAKLEALIDAEMRAIRGNKIDLPLITPAELWQQSGRWQARGPELMTFADRRAALHVLAPTHEESVTSLVASHFAPGSHVGGSLRLYQVGKKFRDEIRPRFGLLRAREFVMKDMYSFDASFEAALETYADVVRAYEAILVTRLRLPVAKVEADSGAIGGSLSHEFHVVADVGEDAILSCATPACGYAANVEKAVGVLPSDAARASATATAAADNDNDELPRRDSSERIQQLLHARDVRVWQALAALGGGSDSDAPAPFTVKVLREHADSGDNDNDSADSGAVGDAEPPRYAVVFARRDREVNALSLKSFFGGEELEAVSASALAALDVAHVQLSVFVDDSLDADTTADATGAALLVARAAAAFDAPDGPVRVHRGHFRVARAGDGCPRCSSHAPLQAKRGIEVGHVFYLGTKYSKPFGVTSGGGPGERDSVLEMGCYGMGVSRLLAAAVEVAHDARGIVWPTAIAPYKVVVLAIGSSSADEPLAQTAVAIARELASGAVAGLDPDDVLLDDRWRERPGSKLAESELLGFPFRVVVGQRFAREGLVEVQTRATLAKDFSGVTTSPCIALVMSLSLSLLLLALQIIGMATVVAHPPPVARELQVVYSSEHHVLFCRDCADLLLEGSVVIPHQSPFNPTKFFVTSALVFAIPNDGSHALYNAHELQGKIAVFTRGKVSVVHKARVAQAAGAVAALVFDSDQCDPGAMHCHRTVGVSPLVGDDNNDRSRNAAHSRRIGPFHDDPPSEWLPVTIPVAMVSADDGARLRSFMDYVAVEVNGEMNWYVGV